MGNYVKTGLTLMVFTLVVGVLLAGIYVLTKAPIEKADLSNQLKAMKTVLTDPESGEYIVPEQQIPTSTAQLEKMVWRKTDNETVFSSSVWKGFIYNPVYHILSNEGKEIAIVSGAASGYGGNVKILASFIKEGNGFDLYRLEVMDYSQETPGLGAKISEERVKERFFDFSSGSLTKGLKVDKDTGIGSLSSPEAINGAKKDGVVYVSDLMTGATITPRAVTNAINTMTEYLSAEWGDE
ncbi:MAG: RnfABCDGE type electron transport complex subunit G [Thermotogae bacterium]|nr:RnfABCDGE type electron transport complex subunit G [Thermotogota bacterium]